MSLVEPIEWQKNGNKKIDNTEIINKSSMYSIGLIKFEYPPVLAINGSAIAL